MKLTPLSKLGNKMDPYFRAGGNFLIRRTASVITPRVPSDPRMTCCTSGPIDSLGTSTALSIVPTDVTIFTRTSMSSMFPYTFFFIPEALVAIHPPTVENSRESGSCPIVTSYFSNLLLMSWPTSPDSTQTSMFSMSIHLIEFISCMSRLTIMRVSSLGHMRAPETEVPPPKGMITTLNWLARLTIFSTCSCDPGQMTTSGTRVSLP
mmetsp:Transcript_32972/g.104260  ORF Transcript_32972/g.104260 Transcript_32972/m.104260 type:complete len:207 (-) Transcript_32972:443-1063(-)